MPSSAAWLYPSEASRFWPHSAGPSPRRVSESTRARCCTPPSRRARQRAPSSPRRGPPSLSSAPRWPPSSWDSPPSRTGLLSPAPYFRQRQSEGTLARISSRPTASNASPRWSTATAVSRRTASRSGTARNAASGCARSRRSRALARRAPGTRRARSGGLPQERARREKEPRRAEDISRGPTAGSHGTQIFEVAIEAQRIDERHLACTMTTTKEIDL